MQENESKKNATTPTKRGGRPKKNSGLGDTIESITTATGIKAAVDWFSEATGVSTADAMPARRSSISCSATRSLSA